ncbi:phage tail spike protein [Enterococcus hulanensis]|uniref:phage tail spike protein n=1 Tax=Enterococcus hulanensis TaxID=2559929 RepID=UPI00288CC8B2|nr:phage tail spike protein [Enterococcus hulanensis]MDT2660707.1 phage tail spike protein [Enterococcus hulanensis]
MQLSIIDRQTKQVLDVLSNEAPFATHFGDTFSGGGLTDNLETGMATYSFEVLKKFNAANHLIKGNEIAFRDKKGQDRLLQILIVEASHDKKTVHCVDTNLVLNNNIARPYQADKEYKITDYINRFLPAKSGFSIGINEIPHLSRKLVWEGHETITKRLRSVATQFDNAYIGFRVVMKGSQVAARFIDIYKKRGKNIGELLQYSKEVNDIHKTEDLSELATALIGIGGAIEGSETQEHVTFKRSQYQSADGRFVSPANDDRVYDLLMGPFWKENKPGMTTFEGYIERTFEFDTQSAQELFNRACNKLKELSQGQNTYEVDVAILKDTIGLGDTVRIVDHDYQPALYLEADVLELTQRLSNKGKNTAVFGNFIEKESKIDAALRMAQEAMKQTQLQALYEWRAYADDDQGTGFTHRYSEGKEYMAILFVRNKPIPSDDPADYIGHWTKIKGSNGINGDDGKTYYPWIVYAEDVKGTGISIDGTGKPYVGVGNGTVPTPSMNPSDYKFSLRYDHSVYENIQKEIDAVPVVTVGKTRPESPKDGDQFWQQDDDGNITGYFKYVIAAGVGAWEPQLVDQALLNIYELNAVNINGSTINGSEFVSEFSGKDDYGQPITGIFKMAGGKIVSNYVYTNEPGRTGSMGLSHEGLWSIISRDGQGVANAGYSLNSVALSMYSKLYETTLSNSRLSLINKATNRKISLDYDGLYMEQRLSLNITKKQSDSSSINWEVLSMAMDDYSNPNSTVWCDIKSRVNFHKNWLNNLNVLNFGADGGSNPTTNKTGSRIFITSDNYLWAGGNWGILFGANNTGAPVTHFKVGRDGLVAYNDLNMNGWKITNQSDIRLKKEIKPTAVDPIKEFERIDFFDFYWDDTNPRNKGKNTKQQYGMIAQYVPFLSDYSSVEKDNYLVIDQGKQINLTTHAVKVLIDENKVLKEQLTNLEDKLDMILNQYPLDQR